MIQDEAIQRARHSSRLPQPGDGCQCSWHRQDAGNGHFETIQEYEPSCPEHSEHVYNPRKGVWDLARQEPTDADVEALSKEIYGEGDPMRTDDQKLAEQLWEAVAEVRDRYPRVFNDAPTDDVVAAILPILRRAQVDEARKALDGLAENYEQDAFIRIRRDKNYSISDRYDHTYGPEPRSWNHSDIVDRLEAVRKLHSPVPGEHDGLPVPGEHGSEPFQDPGPYCSHCSTLADPVSHPCLTLEVLDGRDLDTERLERIELNRQECAHEDGDL